MLVELLGSAIRLMYKVLHGMSSQLWMCTVKQAVKSAEVKKISRSMLYAVMQALESAEIKKSKIQAAERDLQLQRVQGGVQGRPSMLRRFVKSVTAGQGPSLESTIKSLTGQVSMQQQSPPLPSPPLPSPPLPSPPLPSPPHGQKSLANAPARLS